jgi:hypothetical protein
VALREVRECLESLGEMLAKADAASGGPAEKERFDPSVLSDDELWAIEAILAKAANRPPWKPELLVPETLARIVKGRNSEGDIRPNST